MKKKDELLEKINLLEEQGISQTKTWVAMWQDSLKYFFSDQLQGKKVHKDWDWIIINYIWPSAMQEIAKLSKIEPKPVCSPWESSDSDFAEAWQSILTDLWQRGLAKYGMRFEQIKSVLDKKLFGYQVSNIYYELRPHGGWDEKTKKWTGQVTHKLWHPAEFWAIGEENIEDDACGTVRWVDLEWARARWPKYAKELEEQSTTFKDAITGGQGSDFIRGQLASAGTYPGTGYGGIDKGLGTSEKNLLLDLIIKSERMFAANKVNEKQKLVKISQIYFYDYEEEDQKDEQNIPAGELIEAGRITENDGLFYDTSTNEPLDSKDWPKRILNEWIQPKYPNGRFVLKAGKELILNKGEESGEDYRNQQHPYTRWPFIVTPHYLLPHMWQGIDSVQMYKSAQDMINVTVSHLVNNLKQYGDPKIAVETGAIASPPGRTKEHYRIGAGAGAIIRLVRGGLARFKIIDPPQPSQGAFQLYMLFAQEFKNLTGMQPAAMGEREPGEKTATEVQHLVLSSHDRIYLQSLIESIWVKEILKLSAEVARLNYEPGRIIRLIGEDMPQTKEFSREMKDLRFDVDIEAGSAEPMDSEKRIAKYQIAYQILQNPMGNPMTEEMLRVLEIPGRKKILEKYGIWQQFVKFMQVAQKAKEQGIPLQQVLSMAGQSPQGGISQGGQK